MELNGTWYARDCIKAVGKVEYYEPLRAFYFEVTIVLYEKKSEKIFFKSDEEAEQSRKQLIEQLNK